MDPEQITQIFCPHCRKGVAIRGEVPKESECPHCKKSFPTAEYAAPSPILSRTFTSSMPPGQRASGGKGSIPGASPRGNKTPFDERLHLALEPLNAKVSPALFWGMALLSGAITPLVEGVASRMGLLSTFSTLFFLLLLWLRTFGAQASQKSAGSLLSETLAQWNQIATYEKHQKLHLAAISLMSLACFPLASANLLALAELSLRTFMDLNSALSFNGPLRMSGLFALIAGAFLWVIARQLKPPLPAS